MQYNFKDLTGQRFGRLTVIRRVQNNKYNEAMWLCRCDCGNEKTISGKCLRRKNNTSSCGCLQRERAKKSHVTHNMSKSRIFKIWTKIKTRCFNKNIANYKNYGGRGITICKEWKSDFKKFYNWAIKNGYSDNLSIDRIDVNGNYCPENCRWATSKEQARNTRKNHTITFKGETHCISEWAELIGINYGTLYYRIEQGWDFEKNIKTKPNKGGGVAGRKIKCIETGKIYNNYKEIKKEIKKINITGVWKCCAKKQKKCGGYHWEYIN